MPRAMWTGTISFGLVTVPVKMYSAVDRKTVRFHQLSGKSGVRVAQKRVDPSTGEEVAYADLVKGYELAPDRYVVIEDEDAYSLGDWSTFRKVAGLSRTYPYGTVSQTHPGSCTDPGDLSDTTDDEVAIDMEWASAAAPNAAMPATFSVPARVPRSWPPPRMSGSAK